MPADEKPEQLIGYGKPIFPCTWPLEDGTCSCGVPACEDAAKHPLVSGGFKSASADPDQIRQWHNQWPEANWAVPTGEVSGLVVIDADSNEARKAFYEFDLPRTLQVSSGRGEHYYYEHPGSKVKNSASKLAPGLDVRGDNGYVLVPPSKHPSGAYYEWRAGGIDEYAPNSLPGGFVRRLCEPTSDAADGDTWRVEMIPEGKRHDTLMSIAGFQRKFSFR